MRGLLLIGTLIALGLVAYLNLKDARQELKPAGASGQPQPVTKQVQQVQQAVNAAIEQHMKKVRQATQ